VGRRHAPPTDRMKQMRITIGKLAKLLRNSAAAAGVSQAKVLGDQLEKPRTREDRAVPSLGWQSIEVRQSLLFQRLLEK
jgi:imidazoleglycerol phosphate synthase glutamine amidotransferase subunit HisH